MKKYLEECKAAYYAGNPIISDDQYDALEEMCSEDLTVGTNKGRAKHLYRMYSLQKYYVGEDLPTGRYLETPKLDGAAISLTYYNGVLYSVVTRGNGIYGENITHLFTKSSCESAGIPFELPLDKRLFQINGEIVAHKDIANARNYAAGALNLKDYKAFEEKTITFFAYDMQESTLDLYTDTLHYIKSLGFKTIRDRATINYPQDGKVFRLESNQQFKDLGYTNKHPRGAFALKERTEGVMTTLLEVKWETGKSGKVTPVAILDPINIDGANVSRATLNNPGFIKALDLCIGDAVMVERAGGIIPRIIRKAELEEVERATKK